MLYSFFRDFAIFSLQKPSFRTSLCQQILVNNLCDHIVGYSSWRWKKIQPWTRFRRFSLYQSPILYNGSRDGIIRTCDIRMAVTDNWPVLCMRQGVLASVTCIRALRDGNYLLSSGLDGSVSRREFRHVVCAEIYFYSRKQSCACCVCLFYFLSFLFSFMFRLSVLFSSFLPSWISRVAP